VEVSDRHKIKIYQDVEMESNSFWEREETVEEFAGRDPDRRLLELLDRYPQPADVRVLDVGCAGGRNTELLAERGFDVFAFDTSRAMIARTRERVGAILGVAEAERRIRVSHMRDLNLFAAESFDLVVALGVFHNAQDEAEWDQALSEAARVLKVGGRLLASSFSPASEPHGEPVRAVANKAHLFDGFSSGPLFLLTAEELDTRLAKLALRPEVATETVKAPRDEGFRVSVNGLYRKKWRAE
jgi:SAM-dependent methyltransferase